MASFNTTGLDEVMLMIERHGERAEKAVEPMLKAGAAVLAKAQEIEAKRVSKTARSTGTLAASIGATQVKISPKTMGKSVDVFPQGYHPHGHPRKHERGPVSSAQVGFVLEYGRSNMRAQPWMRKANKKASKDVLAAMLKEWEAKQNG